MRNRQDMPKMPRSVAFTFTLLLVSMLFIMLTPTSANLTSGYSYEGTGGGFGLADIAGNVLNILVAPFSETPGGHGFDESMLASAAESLSAGSPLESLRKIVEKKPYIIEHVVQPGDTIWAIMKAYNVDEATIVNANSIANPNALKVGQKLTFPSVTGLTHTVKSGDTVYDIAKKYQVNQQIIMEANELNDGSIKIGQVLVVPGGKMPRTASASSASSGGTGGSGMSFIHPLWRGARITQYFDARYAYRHDGVDWGVPTGTSIKAAASGVVTTAGWGTGYGMLVIVDHGNGYKTYYAHNSKFLVSRGDRVSQGQVIAYSGNTGRSTGPHLHFEIRYNNRPQNPLNFISK